MNIVYIMKYVNIINMTNVMYFRSY